MEAESRRRTAAAREATAILMHAGLI